MTEWRMVTIGEICEYAEDTCAVSSLFLHNYVSTDNMMPDRKGVSFATTKLPQAKTTRKYDSKDILVSNIRPYFKKIWYATNAGGCSADVLVLRPNSKTESQFLYYLLSQQAFFDYVMLAKKGSKMPRGDKNHIMRWSIPLPPLEEQQRISAVLSSLDDKIEHNRRIIEKLEGMAQRLYNFWFVQFDFPDENGKPYNASGGQMTYSPTLNRPIPTAWGVKSLKSIESKIVTGKTPSTAVAGNFGNDVEFLTIDDIRGDIYCFKSKRMLTTIGANSQANKYVPSNSLCVSCIATIGVIGLTGICCQTNQQINTIVFEKDENRYYLLWFLRTYFENSNATKTGNTFANMSKSDFESIPVPYPSHHLLEYFHIQTNSIMNMIKLLTQESLHLSALRDFLLPLLMNGQVKVSND